MAKSKTAVKKVAAATIVVAFALGAAYALANTIVDNARKESYNTLWHESDKRKDELSCGESMELSHLVRVQAASGALSIEQKYNALAGFVMRRENELVRLAKQSRDAHRSEMSAESSERHDGALAILFGTISLMAKFGFWPRPEGSKELQNEQRPGSAEQVSVAKG